MFNDNKIAFENYRIEREFEKQFNKFQFLRTDSLKVEFFARAYTEWIDNELFIIMPINYINHKELNLIFKFVHKYQATIAIWSSASFCIKIKRENALLILKKDKKDENY